MKKLALSTACILALLVTGCSSIPDPEGSDDVTLRITWWGNDDRAEATQEAIALFEDKNPNITVEALPSTFDGYYNKLTTQFAANAAPDVFQDDQVRTFSDRDLLLELNKHDIDLSAIDPEVLNQGSVDGSVFELPAGTSPMAFVYKPALLEAAGVEAPTAETTWDDLGEMAQKVQATMPDGTWALADSSTQPNHFEVFLRQRDKSWFSDDGKSLGFGEEDLSEWWDYWTELRALGVTPAVDVSSAGSGGNVIESPVAKDLVAMAIYGTSVTLPSEDWKYTAIPNEAGNPGVYRMRSSSWAVNAKSEHPEEASKLVDFLVNDPEAAAILGLTRGVPASTTAIDSVREGLSAKEKDIVAYTDYLSQDGNSGSAPNPDPSGTRALRSDIFARYSTQVLFEQATSSEAAANAIQEANDLLASAR